MHDFFLCHPVTVTMKVKGHCIYDNINMESTIVLILSLAEETVFLLLHALGLAQPWQMSARFHQEVKATKKGVGIPAHNAAPLWGSVGWISIQSHNAAPLWSSMTWVSTESHNAVALWSSIVLTSATFPKCFYASICEVLWLCLLWHSPNLKMCTRYFFRLKKGAR